MAPKGQCTQDNRHYSLKWDLWIRLVDPKGILEKVRLRLDEDPESRQKAEEALRKRPLSPQYRR